VATSTALLGRWFVVKRLLAALACCLCALLSGCSDDSSSSADPPPTATTTPADPTSSPTEEVESPEDFLQRWVEADREMENSGNTAEYLAMSKQCSACKGLADQIEGIYKAGGYVKTDGWTILSTKFSKPNKQGVLSATMKIDAAPTKYVEAEGGEVQELDGGVQRQLVTLSASGGTWNVDDIEQIAS
jgi:hypothetical protein